ncbi:uncharacterized protein [Setaria viridis]|uniref:uncharacterized protein n=1 Tax=Setaria viridis TaxID=4556 RepID=UPI003B3B815D
MADAVSPYATILVKSHVPMTLELRSSNYSKWSSFFQAMCGKFGLMGHIHGTPPPNPITAAWSQADCCVRSLLYGSVSDSVLDFTMEDNQTPHQLWVAIERHFQANQAPRAIFLSHEFHSMTQGDLFVEDYNKMKRVADALRAVGQPVADSTLILNLLRGANPRYSTTGDFTAATPNITFAAALDQLALKELHLANEAKVAASTALVASTPSGCGSNCHPPSMPSQQQQGRRKKGNGKRTSGGGGGSQQQGWGGGGGQQQGWGGQQQPRAPSPTGPWICFNPWTIQQAGGSSGAQNWRGGQGWSGGQGLLGSAPQAHTAFGPQVPQYASPHLPASQPAQSWDQAGLIAALQEMSFQGSNPWVLDTGASTHMHNSDGTQDGMRDSSLQ